MKDARTSTRWPNPTRRSPIIAGRGPFPGSTRTVAGAHPTGRTTAPTPTPTTTAAAATTATTTPTDRSHPPTATDTATNTNTEHDPRADDPWPTPHSASTRWPRPATSGSWPTSTRARRPPPSASSTTPGKNYKIGEVHEGAATMDWMDQEHERGITITSAATTCLWHDTLDQHHRHAGPRGLHGRGGALAARARRRGRRVRRRGRRPAPDRDGLAPGQQVQRPAHLLRQQDGPRSAPTSTARSTMIRDRLDAEPAVIQLPIGAESEFRGIVDLVRCSALVFDDGKGEDWHEERDPRRLLAEAEERPPRADRRGLRLRRQRHGEVPGRRGDPAEDLSAPSARRPSPARSCPSSAARPSRTRASSRCSTRWSTTCRARSTSRRPTGTVAGNEDMTSSAASDDSEPSRAWPSRS